MDNTLNARIKLKYDSLSNWTTSTFVPLAGEVCIAYITTNGNIAGNSDAIQGNTPRAIGIKVGDGTHTFANLPWAQAVAADVYNWAKQASPPTASQLSATKTLANSTTQTTTIEAWLQSLSDDMNSLSGGAGSISTQISNAIANLDSNTNTNTLIGSPSTSYTLSAFEQEDGVVKATFSPIQIAESQVTSASGGWITDGLAAKQDNLAFNTTYNATSNKVATMSDISNAVAGLAGAMHFKGSVQTLPTATDSATFAAYEAGDVVLGPNDKEYVYNKGANAAGSSWVELGDETSFAVKGSITDSDIASNAGIAQSKISGLTSDLSLLAPKANPTFTGTVTVPTPSNNTDAATKGYVDAANTTYSFAAGDNDGEIKVTPSTNGTAGTPISVKPKNLHKIATSGSIYDIEEGSNTTTTGSVQYLIFDCGTATTLID